MTISTTCPGCSMAVAAPETAAGHKARCPHCGATIQIPAATVPVGAPAGAPGQGSEAAPPADESPLHFVVQALETPSSTPSRIGGHSSAMRSATTVDRMLARSSPYNTLRLLAAIHLGVGVAAAILVFLAGLVGMIYWSTTGNPIGGILAFAGGLVSAGLFILAGKTISELLRLWADVGDRARHTNSLLEDCVNKMKE
jgi:hypothetical protein